MLRLATTDDEAEVYRMVKAHWDSGPYKTLAFAEDKVRSRVKFFIQNQGTDYITILSCTSEGKPVGILAAFIIIPDFSTDRTAVEQVWWVDEQYRQSKYSFELIKAYEYWADNKAMCKLKHLSLFENELRPRIEKFYNRRGFVPTEQTFVKV